MTTATPTATHRQPPEPRPPAERPRRAAGLELLGRFEDSGFKDPPYLARRRDGQTIQLSRLLYLVADAADGRRDADAIAARVASAVGRRVSADNITFLVERKLRPLGVLAAADGSTPALSKRPPLLALRCRRPLLPERTVRALGLTFAPLFLPPIVLFVVAALVAFDVWLFGSHGVAPGLRAVLYEPALLLALVLGVVAATAFHEIGHAAACRYGGARPGAIGAGIYLVWPAFYCDVTDSYRLDRRGRLRTDLGGIYFNAIVALVAGGAYFATHQEALLLLAVVQHLAMLQQLLPLLRFDGYYVLSDLTGVPDILSRIGPILRSLIPFRPAEAQVRELKPRIRLVVTVYLALLVPVLLLLLLWMVLGAPRVFATAFDSIALHAERVAEEVRRGEWSLTALSSLQIAALLLQCAGIAMIVARTGRTTGHRLMRWSKGSVPRRAVVLAGTAAVACFIAAVWWPDGDYRPLRPGERGTIPDGISGLRQIPDSRPTFSRDPGLEHGRVVAVGAPAPELGGHRSPRDGGTAEGDSPVPDAPADQRWSPSPPRRHPAPVGDQPPARPVPPSGTAGPAPLPAPPDSPAAPEPTPTAPSGDNAAVATNTQDGALMFRLAFDLQYILNGAIDQSNSALAYARCEGCRTIAIAIQVLIATGDLDVIEPTNLAFALNDRCTSCQTLAYAYQLVLALPELRYLSEAGRAKIATILAAIVVLGASDLPIGELRARLDGLMLDLRDVVATELEPAEPAEPAAGTPSREPTATSTPEPTETATPDQTGAAPPDEPAASTPEPTATPTPDQTATPTPDPTATSTPQATATPSPDPTVTPTPTPTPEPMATPAPTP